MNTEMSSMLSEKENTLLNMEMKKRSKSEKCRDFKVQQPTFGWVLLEFTQNKYMNEI